MSHIIPNALIVCFGAGLTLAACALEPNGQAASATSTTTAASTSDHVLPNAIAIDRLVSASCDRELQCKRVGKDLRWSSRDNCTDSMRETAREGMGVSACPSGIDRDHLQVCLDQVSAYGCDQQLTSLLHGETCAPSTVCVSFR